MNSIHSSSRPTDPGRKAVRSFRLPRTPCATPRCRSLVEEAWEETGTLCPCCAIEWDLYDRSGRQERLFAGTH
jgi:hypothetical protein